MRKRFNTISAFGLRDKFRLATLRKSVFGTIAEETPYDRCFREHHRSALGMATVSPQFASSLEPPACRPSLSPRRLRGDVHGVGGGSKSWTRSAHRPAA